MTFTLIAGDAFKLDTGNTAWMMTSAVIVLMMTVPALAFFYGGMVRGKSVLNMLMMNFIAAGTVGLIWILYGYSESFGSATTGINQFFANPFQYFGLINLTDDKGLGAAVGVPALVGVAFQSTFAVITVALITGAIADRIKFSSWIAFTVIWATAVYFPLAHMVWGGGFLSPAGPIASWLSAPIDFAGGTVVHIDAGIAGVVLALFLGRRKGWPKEQMRPHNVPFVLLGAALLWFGWFGFNAGSALAANNLASYAFVNTNTATAAALAGWLIVEKLRDGKATTLGAASGAVAGLVAITPCAGFISPLGSIVGGLLAGAVCALAVAIKGRVRIDDSLDVGAVHLVGGIIGSLCVGLFSTLDTNSLGADGLFYGGGFGLLGKQALAVISVIAYSGTVTLIIAFLINLVIKFRVTEEVEADGLDVSLHGETAYEFTSNGNQPAFVQNSRPAAADKEEVTA